ncbi:MAG: hypothetical protein FWD27_07360 [Coriobacteriia bacterium]|nr:hypothetical protein [Coriobacteriia bacterium]
MKKAAAVLLIIVLSTSLLLGSSCANEGSESQSNAQFETVTIANNTFGDISFRHVSNGSLTVTVELAEYATLGVLGNSVFNQSLQHPAMVDYEKVHIAGDGFNMVIGYTDFRGSGYETYNMFRNYGFWDDAQEVTYGGLEGFSFLHEICFLAFPATTQFGARIIALYPDALEDTELLEEKSQQILKMSEVQDILFTLQFSGEPRNESPFEAEAINNEHFSLTPTDGWELSYHSPRLITYQLSKPDAGNRVFGFADAVLRIDLWKHSSPKEMMEEVLQGSFYDEAVSLDNITINEREFLVVEDRSWANIWLFTSVGESFDEDAPGTLEIKLSYLDTVDEAMKLLETLEIH